MLDIGWTEMLVIGVAALILLGPKELPNALRIGAQWMRQARRLAREFQGGIDEIVREAELDEARRTLQSVTRGGIAREIEKAVDPTGEVKQAFNKPDEDKPAIAVRPNPTSAPTPTPAAADTGSPPAAGVTETAPPHETSPPAAQPADEARTAEKV
jgi:sec-independent protein translocase protein TatB